jgi:hypothetical protein
MAPIWPGFGAAGAKVTRPHPDLLPREKGTLSLRRSEMTLADLAARPIFATKMVSTLSALQAARAYGASYLGLRSSDSLRPRLSNYGPSARTFLPL